MVRENNSILFYFNDGLWCNGNTTGFGSVIPGSNPSRPTIQTAILKQLPYEQSNIQIPFVVRHSFILWNNSVYFV